MRKAQGKGVGSKKTCSTDKNCLAKYLLWLRELLCLELVLGQSCLDF